LNLFILAARILHQVSLDSPFLIFGGGGRGIACADGKQLDTVVPHLPSILYILLIYWLSVDRQQEDALFT
jgi:mannose/fructose/N-acetylgalactosamine-specific phosphotransferase system component IID